MVDFIDTSSQQIGRIYALFSDDYDGGEFCKGLIFSHEAGQLVLTVGRSLFAGLAGNETGASEMPKMHDLLQGWNWHELIIWLTLIKLNFRLIHWCFGIYTEKIVLPWLKPVGYKVYPKFFLLFWLLSWPFALAEPPIGVNPLEPVAILIFFALVDDWDEPGVLLTPRLDSLPFLFESVEPALVRVNVFR